MTQRKAALATIFAIITIGLALLFALRDLHRDINNDMPSTLSPPPLTDPPMTHSYINVPVSIPMQLLERELEDAIPHEFEFPSSKQSGTFLRAPYCAYFEPAKFRITKLDITPQGQRIAVLIEAADPRITVQIKLGSCQRRASGLDLKVAVEFRLSIKAGLSVATDWNLQLVDLLVGFKVNEALVKVPYWPRKMDVAKDLESELRREVEREVRKELRDTVGDIRRHRTNARIVWNELCRTVDLDPELGLQLMIEPKKAYVEQPKLSRKNLVVNVGLELQTRAGIALSADQPSNCPFPNRIGSRAPGAPGFSIAVPADITYSDLESVMSSHLVGASLQTGHPMSVSVSDVGVNGHGSSILLKLVLDGVVESGWFKWFNRKVRGTVYLAAVPKLNAEDQTLTFRDIQVDTASSKVLIDIAGKRLKRTLLSFLKERAIVDLEAVLGEGRTSIETALADLTSSDNLDASLKDLVLTSLEVGPTGLRVLMRVDGKLNVNFKE